MLQPASSSIPATDRDATVLPSALTVSTCEEAEFLRLHQPAFEASLPIDDTRAQTQSPATPQPSLLRIPKAFLMQRMLLKAALASHHAPQGATCDIMTDPLYQIAVCDIPLSIWHTHPAYKYYAVL